ncbi:hypothetical protein PG994_012439 [Apiospora phragmitis]|uniref:Uncharacterized protein n=1 Tax=Apiospora phragmitis TaxID=2905665 RepID=A0ABR1TVN7_9PEZI
MAAREEFPYGDVIESVIAKVFYDHLALFRIECEDDSTVKELLHFEDHPTEGDDTVSVSHATVPPSRANHGSSKIPAPDVNHFNGYAHMSAEDHI